MDYKKIGDFISTLRKSQNLTQTKLAEKLFVSEKTISKWENGKGIPDANSLLNMSEIFGVSINELLNGEKFSQENYSQKAENKLLELQNAKQESDKRLLFSEIVLGGVSTILFIIILFACSYAIEQLNIVVAPVIFLSVSAVFYLIALIYCFHIERVAGYYKCSHCQHKYMPTFKQIFFSMHMGRTRYFKCPHCGKKSWNKKVLK